MSPTNRNRVLQISNSTLYGSGYLDHAESEIRDFLGRIREVLFIPYAGSSFWIEAGIDEA